jgi:hypothetical protein
MTGAGKIKVNQGETCENRQEVLNGDQVTTEKRRRVVANSRETSEGRRRAADVGVYIKALSNTEEKLLAALA